MIELVGLGALLLAGGLFAAIAVLRLINDIDEAWRRIQWG